MTVAGGGVSFELLPEQLDLRQAAHDFAARELRPRAAAADREAAFPQDLLPRAAELGMTAYAIPARYGGIGVDALSAALVAEELAWGCAGLAGTLGATQFPVRPLLHFGTEEQQERYLPLLASRTGARGAVALTEPGAGSDVDAIKTAAVRTSGGYRVSGEKRLITNGGRAEVTILFAKLDGRLTAFVLEAGDGARGGRPDDKLGVRATQTAPIVLDDVFLRPDRLLGAEGAGLEIALDFLVASRVQVAAEAVGIARAALEYATDYAHERRTFGRPLVAHQAIAFKLAERSMEIEAARLLVWRAAAAVDRDPDAPLLSSYAKAFAADAAVHATTAAVEILGGGGVTSDHPTEKWFRDARMYQVVEGTAEIQRQIIAAQLLRRQPPQPR